MPPSVRISGKTALTHRLKKHKGGVVHIIVIGTKPDIIKQYPLYFELKKRGEFVLICHTDQHYDFRYSKAVEQEFDIPVDIHLGVKGSAAERLGQIIDRFSKVCEWLKTFSVTPVPYVHGDTATALACAVGAHTVGCASVHIEAGVRTLTPKREHFVQLRKDTKKGAGVWWNAYQKLMSTPSEFERGSTEPYPEQFNTHAIVGTAGIHIVPTAHQRDFLEAEGVPRNRIFVAGNTIADAVQNALEKADKSAMLKKFPALKKGAFIRYCIHRRENTLNEDRFRVYFGAMERLVHTGHQVLLISHSGCEQAIDSFGLRARVNALVADYPDTFIYSDVTAYHKDSIALTALCRVIATDSGGMQEEANILGVPCVTLRYGTDRPETLFAGSNFIAPPLSVELVTALVTQVYAAAPKLKGARVYKPNVSKRIVDHIIRFLATKEFFPKENHRLNLHPRLP
jgi:UDP-N-acetylglucosamine 2-epimerase (non-hydrolysing)